MLAIQTLEVGMAKKEIVKRWVKQLVIDLNLCPFAYPVFKKIKLHMNSSNQLNFQIT